METRYANAMDAMRSARPMIPGMTNAVFPTRPRAALRALMWFNGTPDGGPYDLALLDGAIGFLREDVPAERELKELLSGLLPALEEASGQAKARPSYRIGIRYASGTGAAIEAYDPERSADAPGAGPGTAIIEIPASVVEAIREDAIAGYIAMQNAIDRQIAEAMGIQGQEIARTTQA